ncbi:hypothetical protein Atai01_62490 [Amycolatopsis taiwanensis]|uniref:Uncharacterized protein n=1 Tax=Amycolatopsis taiwanensis TaxID=342230 RepID=A0A9W6R7C3_9PSEU|nr:hypothetical protein Atai01_62490 [Amycolatopsis taiwanensis]
MRPPHGCGLVSGTQHKAQLRRVQQIRESPRHRRIVRWPRSGAPGLHTHRGASGQPATTPIRQRFEDADVDRLLRAAWWDWPVELVTEHANRMARCGALWTALENGALTRIVT